MKNILVIEEELDTRRVLRELLEDAGYGVVSASTPGEALFLVGRIPRPCAIVLGTDDRTPRSVRLLREVRGSWGDVPLIPIDRPLQPGALLEALDLQRPA